MDSIALPAPVRGACGVSEQNISSHQHDGCAAAPGFIERDRLAHDVYQSVLQTGRGDWIELMNCAPLASQYHLSTYSTLKFGYGGSLRH